MGRLSEIDELLWTWRSLNRAEIGEGWQVIPIGSGRCRAGVRFPGNEEVLLVGFNIGSSATSDLPQGRGFSVLRVSETKIGDFDVWLGIARKPAANIDFFAIMAADVFASVDKLSKTDEMVTYYRFLSRIRSWQKFMEQPRDRRLSDDEELGLIGELSVVQRLLRKGVSANLVMDFWKGPANGLRDFMTDALDIEVKSTIATNSFPAHISSLEQLDDGGRVEVYLAALRFSVHEVGIRLPVLVDLVRAEIGDAGRVAFERSLVLAGYQDAYAAEYTRSFVLVDERLFLVSEDFPRLSRSHIPLSIRSAEYQLDLELLDTKSLKLDDIIFTLGGMYQL